MSLSSSAKVIQPYESPWSKFELCFMMDNQVFYSQLQAAASRQLPGLSHHPNLKQYRHLEADIVSFPALLESLGLVQWPSQGAAWKLVLVAGKTSSMQRRLRR